VCLCVCSSMLSCELLSVVRRTRTVLPIRTRSAVGVMKDYKLKLGSYTPRIHWVGRGTGTPKDRDEVNNR
jgi:hypothetical protein